MTISPASHHSAGQQTLQHTSPWLEVTTCQLHILQTQSSQNSRSLVVPAFCQEAALTTTCARCGLAAATKGRVVCERAMVN